MSAAKQVTLHLVAPDEEDSATRRIHRLMLQRETLRPMFLVAWDDLSHRFDVNELEAWAGAVLTLAHVNAGPACLIAFWEASKSGGAADRQEIAPTLGGRPDGRRHLPKRWRAGCDRCTAGAAGCHACVRQRSGPRKVVADDGAAGAAGAGIGCAGR